MMRAWSLGILLVSTTMAQADESKPKPAAALTPAAQKQYKASLAKGRALQGKKKYADAIAAFDDALKASPDDPTALGELGWTAYLAKDLKKAEAMTRKSLAGQAAPNIRGASLYNLGLIEEELGDKKAAIASYGESLKVRPNGVVRAKLTALDPTAAAAFEPFAPHKLSGPYKSVDAYCKAEPPNSDDNPDHCWCGTAVETTAIKVTKPFDAIQAFAYACSDNEAGSKSYAIAVKLAAGWYVDTIKEVELARHCDESIAFKPSAQQGASLLVEFAVTGDCSGGTLTEEWSEDWVLAMGIGPSKVPSSTRILATRRESMQSDPFEPKPPPAKVSVDVAFQLAWGKDGAVELTGKTKGLDKDEASNLLGKHTLVFP